MPKPENLSGQRFGRLTVLNLAPPHITAGGSKVVCWHCKCDCGKETIVQAQKLKAGKTKSCGCYFKETAGQYHKLEIVGQRFGKWRVIAPTDEARYYMCKCDCGNEKKVFASSLTTGKSQSCGCETSKRFLKDLTGQKIGRWTVQYRAENRGPNVFWHCKCDCGNEKDVSSSALLSGDSQSCGCLNSEINSAKAIIDLTGRKIGLWTVQYRVENRGLNVYWHCKCDCGNEKDVPSRALLSEQSQSCGCLSMPMGEFTIDDVLNVLDVDYTRQIKFDDLTGLGGMKLSYDFAIYDTSKELVCLIEYQGQQHYEPINYFGGIANYEKQQMHDELKREYAEKYLKVPLLEIPYTVNTFQNIFDMIVRFLWDIKYYTK